MAVLQNIGRALKNLFGRGTPVSSLTVTTIGNQEVYVPIDTDKAISEGYNGNTAVYSIVGKDARKFASVPVHLYKVNSEEEERLDNDLSKLLNRPNDMEGQDFFREKLRTYYKLTGETFIWLNRGALVDEIEGKERLKKPVLEMYVLPTDYVTIKPDPSNVFGLLGYFLDINGTKLPLHKEDVIHWKNVSLTFDASSRDHLRGRSPLSPGYKTLQQNNSATDAAVRMYQNDGAKGVLFNETLDKMNPQQRAQIEGVVDRRVNSNDVKGSVATLQGKWGYLDLGKSNTDLGLLEGKNLSMQELCFLYDVPFEFFDSKTTFANKEQAQKGWVLNSIIPACKQFDDELNRVLLQAFGLEGQAIIESDFDNLPEMQEDMAKKVTALMAAWPITPDEVRDALGYEPLGGKFAEPWVPQSVVPLSETGLNIDQIAADLAAQGLND